MVHYLLFPCTFTDDGPVVRNQKFLRGHFSSTSEDTYNYRKHKHTTAIHMYGQDVHIIHDSYLNRLEIAISVVGLVVSSRPPHFFRAKSDS